MICETCGGEGGSPIQVVEVEGRLYLPNIEARGFATNLRELPLCHTCCRKIEDSFRATVGYLKAENHLE